MNNTEHQHSLKHVAEALRKEGVEYLSPGLMREMERQERKEVRRYTCEIILAKESDRETALLEANEEIARQHVGDRKWNFAVSIQEEIVGGWIIRTPTFEVDRSYRTLLLSLFRRLITSKVT